MQYKKKPIIVEAFQYAYDPRPDWFNDAVTDCRVETYIGDGSEEAYFRNNPKEYYCVIETLEGKMKCNSGDYVIQGVEGELYPCKKDIFEKTYESAEEFKNINDIEDISLFQDEETLTIDEDGTLIHLI